MSFTRHSEVLDAARAFKDEMSVRLFGVRAFAAGEPAAIVPERSNIVGIGYGAKVAEGAILAEELAVRVYVRTKFPKDALARTEIVPASVNGLPTDVIAVGDVRAMARPVPCGVSIGHFAITAGTLGCLVRRNNDPARIYILSNNHVLANSNAGAAGDDILEPGPLDGGARGNPIARLAAWEPLIFGGAANHIDAAIAELINPADVTVDIRIIGPINGMPMPARLYQSVRKHGRTTLHTVGVIMDLSADINVLYGSQTAHFEDQLAVIGAGGGFSSGGDSGSLVVDAVLKQPVGLLFAGGGASTFVNPIDQVLSRLNLQVV